MSKLNKIQEKATNTIDINLSLKAGAGTGKTKVLTERFLNILENGDLEKGKEFDEILAITFTNKAADEMKGRILKELRKKRKDNKFKNLYKYFSKANILTIHGFCTNVIKENPLVVGIDPNFKVADERISRILLKESVEEALSREIENSLLIDLLTKRGDISLKDLSTDLAYLLSDTRNNGYTIKELKKYHEDYYNSLGNVDFTNVIKLIKSYEDFVTGTKYKSLMKTEEYAQFFISPNMEYLQIIKDSLGAGTGLEQEELRNKINTEIEKLNQILEIELEKYYQLIFELLENIEEIYKKKKREKVILDYSDLQFLALEIIKKVDSYKTKYKYIMIDEFQDTDRLQVELFKYLSSIGTGQANIFVVGDPKQSIYGFRGSNLEEYYKFTQNIINSGGEELIMEENYRSSSSLINSFNEIFKKLLKDKYDSLVPKAVFDEKEILKIETLSISENKELDEEDQKKAEAIVIANRIAQLIEMGEKPWEIAVLYRRKKYIRLLEEELLKLNILVNNTSQEFNAKTEIKDIIIFLKAVSNKYDFLSFLAYLRSPLVGLNDNSIFIIGKYFDKEKYYLDNNYLELLEEKEKELYLEGYKNLIKIKKIKPILSLSELIKESIKISDYYEISTMLYGFSASKNLDKLIDIAQEFEKEISSNIFEFIEYLNETEINVEEEENAVNLITIHKSKGLEFENVIIAEMDNKFNTKSSNNFFEYSDLGIACKFEDINSKYSLISKDKKSKSIEEETRMFYVATTRAKKRLIFSIVNIEEKKDYSNTYYNLFLESEFNNYRNIEIEKFQNTNIQDINFDDEFFEIDKKEDEKSLVKKSYIKKLRKVRYYSATSYMSFKRSKEEYFRKFILAEDIITSSNYSEETKVLDPIIRGNIVHSYAEKNPKDIDKFISKSLKNYGVIESEENINLLKEQFKNYEMSLKGEVLYKELEFYYPLKNGVIHGYIDQIRKDKGIEIIDFKTSYNSDEELLEYYYPQLQIYTRAFEKISGQKVSSAKLLFLSNNEEFDVDISEESINKTLKDFENYIDFVENHREFKDYID